MYTELITKAHEAQNANTKFEKLEKPSPAQKAAFAALEAAVEQAVSDLQEKREAFIATLK